MEISSQNIRFIFGLKLKQLRTENNYSLSELSKHTGISKSYLNEIEKGKKYPKPEKINTLAKALHTSYDQLVSLQLDKKLAPISSLIKSNILNELPLDFFGIEAHDLLVLLSNAPTQFSAFVDAIIRIGREHDFKVESLYFSVLRSYQEMNNNYFPKLEQAAKSWRKKMQLGHSARQLKNKLIEQLTHQYHYQIQLDGFSLKPTLKHLRHLMLPGSPPRLLINKNLTEAQVIFILTRELSYCLLDIKKRPLTSSWIESQSFEHVLSNFKSYYMASAFLLDERPFTKGLVDFTQKPVFNPQEVVDLIHSNNVSAEAFMLRITNLVPKYFRYSNLFFTRYNHTLTDDSIVLNKALNGAGLGQSSANNIGIKACQRWVALQNLALLKENPQSFCSIHKVRFQNEPQQFLVISMSHPVTPGHQLNCTISVGFLMDSRFMAQTKFAHNSNIPAHTVTYNWLAAQTNVYDGISTRPMLAREQARAYLKEEIKKMME